MTLKRDDRQSIAEAQKRDEKMPYCEAQAMGTLCGKPVIEWGHQCPYHDPEGRTRK